MKILKFKAQCPFFFERITIYGLLVAVLLWFFKLGIGMDDFYGQWLICKYFLKGINPYIQISPDTLELYGLEPIPSGWGTSPWGCLLGQLFYAGWLPFAAAKIWFISLYVIVYLLVCVCLIYLYPFKKKYFITLFAVGLVSWLFPILHGNIGGTICLLLIMALEIKYHHNILAGLLLAFSLIKPQTSLLFCLYFLFQRNFKVLFVAAFIDILAWYVVATHLNSGMLEILRQMFESNVGCGNQYNGIMTFLAPALADFSSTMYLSMVVGIVYSIILYIFICRNYGRNGFVAYLPFCVATSFWCYSWGNELTVLLPVAAFCLLRYGRAADGQKKYLYILFVLSSFGLICPLALSKVFGDWRIAMEVYSLLCGTMFAFVIIRTFHDPSGKSLRH